jgi:hypothetical protein
MHVKLFYQKYILLDLVLYYCYIRKNTSLGIRLVLSHLGSYIQQKGFIH